MYNYNNPHYLAKTSESLKVSSIFAGIMILSLVLFSCGGEPQDTGELFRPIADSTGSLYPYSLLDEIKLSEEGKRQARRAWDSLSPSLLKDSTTTGFKYGFMVPEETDDSFCLCLQFDNDTIYGPSDAKIVALFHSPLSAPERVMYMGSTPVNCYDRTSNNDNYGVFVDSLAVIIDHGMQEVLSGKGFRFDISSGPTTKFSPAQALHYRRTMTAYQATRVLHNPLNKPK